MYIHINIFVYAYIFIYMYLIIFWIDSVNPICYYTPQSAQQSLSSPIDLYMRRIYNKQFHVLEHRDTYGQAQVISKGHQGNSVAAIFS